MSNPFEDVKSVNMDIRRVAEVKITEMLKNDKSMIELVLENIRTGDVNSRWYLGRALMHAGPEIIPDLVEHAKTEEDTDVLKYIGAVLAALGELAIEPLISLFASENAKVRGMAGAALERLGEVAWESLFKAAESDNPLIHQCSQFVLQKAGVYQF